MVENKDGSGYFKEVTLRPVVTISNTQPLEKLDQIHALAHKKCFIANSVNFPVHHEAICMVES
jgi:organic hydroperoxide reductase OsmC/OhrA